MIRHTNTARLFQEDLCRTPFWMLVACILVNRTRWTNQAEPVFNRLRYNYNSSSLRLAHANIMTIRFIVQPLGLQKARARSLLAFAEHYRFAKATTKKITSEHVRAMPGCGRYAADSWAIFVEKRTDVKPTDAKLRAYLRRMKKPKRSRR